VKSIEEIINDMPADRRAELELRARDLLQEQAVLLVAENLRLTRALRKFVKWFDRHEHDVSEAIDGVGDVTVFYDLQEAADEARSALGGGKL
jgi:hypothetical protein